MSGYSRSGSYPSGLMETKGQRLSLVFLRLHGHQRISSLRRAAERASRAKTSAPRSPLSSASSARRNSAAPEWRRKARRPGHLDRRLDVAVPFPGHAAADDDALWVEDVENVGETDAEVLGSLVDDVVRQGVSGLRGGEHLAGGDAARRPADELEDAGRLAGEEAVAHLARDARAGTQAFPAAGPAALAGRRPAGDDNGVSELPRAAEGAAVEAARSDHAASNPGADREVDHVPRPASRAQDVLADGRSVRIVLEGDGDAEGGADELPERSVLELREVRRLDDRPLAVVHGAGDRHAASGNRASGVRREAARGIGDALGEQLGAMAGGGPEDLLDHPQAWSKGEGHARGRPADIHAGEVRAGSVRRRHAAPVYPARSPGRRTHGRVARVSRW